MAEKQLIFIIGIQSTIINLAEASFLAALQGKAGKSNSHFSGTEGSVVKQVSAVSCRAVISTFS